MTTRVYVVYRVRGRHYVRYHRLDTCPSSLGHELVIGIPKSPGELKAWKLRKIQWYKRAEEQTKFLERENPHRESDNWSYRMKPSRVCPLVTGIVDWMYIVDLDLNVFRVVENDRDPPDPGMVHTQYFRLDRIPRHLFSYYRKRNCPLMIESFPAKYMATHLDSIPEPDPVLLELFESFDPPPEATFAPPSGERRSTWHTLQLELIREFADYFWNSIRDSCPSRTSSPFVFRQIAYAVLCLTSRSGLKLHRCTAAYLVDADSICPTQRTPTWEPPTTNTYWLGDVLIVLDQHLSIDSPSANSKASIARAVQLAREAQHAPATPTTAVIFSVNALILVHITPGEPITHTAPLPLFPLDPAEIPFPPRNFANLESLSCATTGVLALLDLFNAHPRVPRFAAVSSTCLPAELCRIVFQAADEPTQDALEASCRLFRAVAGEYPRIGGRTLDKWGPDDGLKLGGLDGSGWQVGVWGREKVELNMPVVRMRTPVSVRCEDLGIYLE